MSGYFDYIQNQFEETINEINILIESDEYDSSTVDEFREAIRKIKTLRIVLDRIDFLASGEESEDSFHQGLMDDYEEMDHSEFVELRF